MTVNASSGIYRYPKSGWVDGVYSTAPGGGGELQQFTPTLTPRTFESFSVGQNGIGASGLDGALQNTSIVDTPVLGGNRALAAAVTQGAVEQFHGGYVTLDSRQRGSGFVIYTQFKVRIPAGYNVNAQSVGHMKFMRTTFYQHPTSNEIPSFHLTAQILAGASNEPVGMRLEIEGTGSEGIEDFNFDFAYDQTHTLEFVAIINADGSITQRFYFNHVYIGSASAPDALNDTDHLEQIRILDQYNGTVPQDQEMYFDDLFITYDSDPPFNVDENTNAYIGLVYPWSDGTLRNTQEPL